MISLEGKRIFVTGAAAGMGRSIAELSAAAGAEVLATDVAKEGLAELEAKGIQTAVLDATDKDAIDDLFGRQAPFTGIVNTAGWVHHGTLTETDDAAWRRSFNINVDSMFYVISAALPGMVKNGGGSIINMASIASSIKGFKFRAAYASSKAAVIGLTKSVAVDYMDDGIRCNAICPGTTETPSLHGRMNALVDELGSFEAARQWFVDRQPMKRLGQPDEIGMFALYLLSDAGNFATGQSYIIDGGILA
ncbi:MAG TPA: NAD(P)-dependent oxidoreductase [Rhodobacteraceae bacterium]|nr:NAD(P)-dependent oxidoreductase [Paracoccaceae bacterium]